MRFSSSVLTTLFLTAAGCSSSPNDASSDGGPDNRGADGSVAAANDGFAWAKSFAAGSGSIVMAMAADSSGVVIAGSLQGTGTFGTTPLTAAGIGAGFIAKLDATGNVLWAKATTGSSGEFEALAIDSAGNILVSGTDFGDAPTFTLGSTTLTPEVGTMLNGTQTTGGGAAIFKLDANGNVAWGKFANTTGEVNMGSIAISGSTIYVAGPIIHDAAFAPAGAMPVTGCDTAGCVYLAAYDMDGNTLWAKQAPSSPHRGTGADPREIWLAATSTKLDLAIGGSFSQAGSSSPDVMELVVSQYDLTGALTWTKVTPSQDAPSVNGLVVDAMGNLYVAGDSAGITLGSIAPLQYARPFFVKYTSTGDLAWTVGTSDVGVRTPSNTALALSDHLYTFGNGGVIPATMSSGMAGDLFDPATGALTSEVPCAASQGLGQEIAASSAGVYVGGYGGTPSQFGKQTLSALGLFVAKLK